MIFHIHQAQGLQRVLFVLDAGDYREHFIEVSRLDERAVNITDYTIVTEKLSLLFRAHSFRETITRKAI